jgi:hypothetical protein
MLSVSINNERYTLSRKQLDKFPESILFKAVNGVHDDDEFVIKDETDNNHVYLMVDNDSGEYLMSYLKGHVIRPHTIDGDVLVKLFEDSKNLNLTDLTNCITPYITTSNPTLAKTMIMASAILCEKGFDFLGINDTGIVESVKEYLETPVAAANIELVTKEQYGKKNINKEIFSSISAIILKKAISAICVSPTMEPALGENTDVNTESVYSGDETDDSSDLSEEGGVEHSKMKQILEMKQLLEKGERRWCRNIKEKEGG